MSAISPTWDMVAKERFPTLSKDWKNVPAVPIPRRPGYVYLVRVKLPPHLTAKSKGTGYYKIGRSGAQVNQRVSMLQTGCPFPLLLVADFYCDDCEQMEVSFHCKYHKWRGLGEWFAFPLAIAGQVEIAFRLEHNFRKLPKSENSSCV